MSDLAPSPVQTRWQYTMQPAMPPMKRDVLCMVGALGVMFGVCVPLARAATDFQYVPPLAVLLTGVAYFALANFAHKAAKSGAWRKPSLQCAAAAAIAAVPSCPHCTTRWAARNCLCLLTL